MDPVNKLYFFDWKILINTEYVVYIMCVCVLTFMWIEYIYILLYIRYQFSFPPIFIIDLPYNHNPDYYICCSHCLFIQPIQFFSNIFFIIFHFSLNFLLLLLYATIYFVKVFHKYTYNYLFIFYIYFPYCL